MYLLDLSVSGLDLPVKLRRALGQGAIVSAEVLVTRLTPYDKDGSGALDREQLTRFLIENRVGGPWFCQMMAHNVFRTAEDRWSMDVASIKIVALARIINYTMARVSKPVKRYVLTPDVVNGLEPKRGLDGSDPTVPTDLLVQQQQGRRGAPRSAAPRTAGPRTGAGPRKVAPRGPRRPAGTAAAPRTSGRTPPRGRPSGRVRPSGRAGPRGGARRPGKPRA